jgi:hypothetical protein
MVVVVVPPPPGRSDSARWQPELPRAFAHQGSVAMLADSAGPVRGVARSQLISVTLNRLYCRGITLISLVATIGCTHSPEPGLTLDLSLDQLSGNITAGQQCYFNLPVRVWRPATGPISGSGESMHTSVVNGLSTGIHVTYRSWNSRCAAAPQQPSDNCTITSPTTDQVAGLLETAGHVRQWFQPSKAPTIKDSKKLTEGWRRPVICEPMAPVQTLCT